MEKIDYSTDAESAEEILVKYDLNFLPVVILQDGNGSISFKSEFDFNESEFESKLLLAFDNPSPKKSEIGR